MKSGTSWRVPLLSIKFECHDRLTSQRYKLRLELLAMVQKAINRIDAPVRDEIIQEAIVEGTLNRALNNSSQL